MSPGRIAAALLLSATARIGAGGTAERAVPILTTIVDVRLPGPTARFDYQSLDTTTNRLYVSHMGAGRLLVFDLARRRVERVARDLPRITGVCSVPALRKVYASVPGRQEVVVLDAASLRVRARLGPIGFPDAIAWAPGPGKLYVSDESGGGELVIDGRTDRVVTRIPLGGEAGNTLYDPVTQSILVAVQTSAEWVEIDPRSDRVRARHALPGSRGPHGLALDSAARVLFVASEDGAAVQSVDLRDGRVLDRQPVGVDPDVLAFDPIQRRLYVASESGLVTVLEERSGRLARVEEVTMPHAHTVSLDPRTHALYFPLQDLGGRPVLRIMAAAGP